MRTIAIVILFASLAAGCAYNYEPPDIVGTPLAGAIPGASKDAIFDAASKTLIAGGHLIGATDRTAGVISTRMRQFRLTERDVDCGTALGLPYIKDKRTITSVGFGIVVSEGRIEITTSLEGEYLKGHVSQSIALTCVSKGGIERRLFEQIRAAAL